MKNTIPILLLVLCFATPALAQKPKSVKVTVTIRGMVTEKDAEAVRASLKNVNGIKVALDEIGPGNKGRFGHYFSPPFVIEITDLNKADIGPLASVIAKTKTPSRKEVAPSLNLVLYHSEGAIREKDVADLRAALTDVNGIEAQASGGIGGSLNEGRFWARLEAAGGADLAGVVAALKKAGLKVQLEKP